MVKSGLRLVLMMLALLRNSGRLLFESRTDGLSNLDLLLMKNCTLIYVCMISTSNCSRSYSSTSSGPTWSKSMTPWGDNQFIVHVITSPLATHEGLSPFFWHSLGRMGLRFGFINQDCRCFTTGVLNRKESSTSTGTITLSPRLDFELNCRFASEITLFMPFLGELVISET